MTAEAVLYLAEKAVGRASDCTASWALDGAASRALDGWVKPPPNSA